MTYSIEIKDETMFDDLERAFKSDQVWSNINKPDSPIKPFKGWNVYISIKHAIILAALEPNGRYAPLCSKLHDLGYTVKGWGVKMVMDKLKGECVIGGNAS